MRPRDINRNQLYSFLILIIYCISLTPSLIFHHHEDGHQHNEVHLCESLHQTLYSQTPHNHLDCSHDHHYENIIDDCFLCTNLIVVDHISDISNIEYKDIYILDIDCQLSENLCLDKFNIFRNKSPPRII